MMGTFTLWKIHPLAHGSCRFSIVLLSNQAQRNAGALKAWEAKKIPNIATAVRKLEQENVLYFDLCIAQCPDLPFRIFGAKEKDGFRKPMPGVWYELQKIFADHGVDIGPFSCHFTVFDRPQLG